MQGDEPYCYRCRQTYGCICPPGKQFVAPSTIIAELESRIEDLEEALYRIAQWSRAYPTDVFPEPDLKRAHEVLKAAGMGIDGISAGAMRHALEGVGRIAIDALPKEKEPPM